MQRKTARFKRVLVLTERFNIPANDFDAKKNLLIATGCSFQPNSLQARPSVIATDSLF